MKKIKITESQLKLLENNGIDTSKITKTFNNQLRQSGEKPLNEADGNSIQAFKDVIEAIWLNNTNIKLDRYFVENGITLGDILAYLTSIGVVTVIGSGLYKVVNYFKTKFSKDPTEAAKQKAIEINKLAKLAAEKETTWEKKVRLQQKPESGWEAKPKGFRPPKRKGMEEESNYPPGSENDPNMPWNQDNSDYQDPMGGEYNAIAMNYEIAILQKGNEKYVFYFDNISKDDFLNPKYELDLDEITDYVNRNIDTIKIGDGVSGWDSDAELIKIDDQLKNELILLYSKSKSIVSALSGIDEVTGSASSGAFVGPFMGDDQEEPIDEVTTTASSGSYVQPAIWAKDKKSWKGDKKTQYPNGEFVSVNSGKIKTKKTKQSVISKTMYEAIAKKTGKSISEIQTIIENWEKNKNL